MIKQLENAMEEEKRYVADRMNGIDTSLKERLVQYGYETLDEYFKEKKEYLWKQWIPEVHYIDENYLDDHLEQDIVDCNDGVYIIVPKSNHYAFHGSDEIDCERCGLIGIRVIEMNYRGGTIVGSSEDLGILFIIPSELQIDSQWIMENILMIVQEYVPEAEQSGNDILVNGEKVMGSMTRNIGKSFVWAAQFTFGDYGKLIPTVCKKEMVKKVGKFIPEQLTRNILEGRLVEWLCKLEH